MEKRSMVMGLWGRKIGMTQLFSENTVVPVTAVDVSGWFVTNIRTEERDGYRAVQVARVKTRYAKDKFNLDWVKSPKKYFSDVKEIKLASAEEESLVIGKPVNFLSFLQQGDKVDAFGRSKGCGFAGVVKRHNFTGAPASHGAMMGDRPGSIGGACSQGKVRKGKKLPGHMGNSRSFIKGLEIVRIESGLDIVFVKGSIPGKAGSLVFLRKEKAL